MFREIEIDEIKDCGDFFLYLLEETQQYIEQTILPTEYNVHLFMHLLTISIREHKIRPFAYVEDDDQIGAIIFTLNVTPFEVKEITVCTFGTYVKPKHRNKGIATQLAEFAHEELKKKDVKFVYGRVFIERETSETYAKSLGLEITNGNVCKRL